MPFEVLLGGARFLELLVGHLAAQRFPLLELLPVLPLFHPVVLPPLLLAQRWQRLARLVTEEEIDEAARKRSEEGEEFSTKDLLVSVHVAHNSGENEWYTPKEYLEAARAVMGGIDTDPASSAKANELVQAKEYFDAGSNGLGRKWGKRVWLNPPYAQPLVSEFSAALVEKVKSGEVKQACVLVNNATETEWFQGLLQVTKSVCFVKGRIKYLDRTCEPANTPLQGQAILYFGSRRNSFRTHFKQFGEVLWKP